MMKVVEAAKAEDMSRLLERRESWRRMSGLHFVVAGANCLFDPGLKAYSDEAGGGSVGKEHARCLAKLIGLGARLEAKDLGGYTPLHRCFTHGSQNDVAAELARVLLDHGANVNTQNRAAELGT